MSLSNKGKQQILRQQMHAKFPFLIKIDWGNGTISRFSNTDEDVVFDGNTYTAYSFSIMFPEISETGVKGGSFKMSELNDNTNIIGLIRTIGSRPTIEIMGVMVYSEQGQLEEIESIYDMKLYMLNPSWGEDTAITWTLNLDDGLDVNMPCDEMNEITCSGVV